MGNSYQIALSRPAPVPFLSKARRYDDGAPNPLFATLDQRLCHTLAGDHYDRQVNGSGHGQYARIALEPKKRASPRIDRVDRALEAVMDHILQDAVSQLAWRPRRAYDGYCLWIAKHLEHGRSAPKVV
jgi:hypothetical protein